MGVVLVIGCGSIGARHARNLRALGVTDLRLVDADPGRAAGLAAELGATTHASHTEALSGVGLALVCTPPAFHLEHAAAAVEAGWDLFVEKPLATSMSEVEALVAVAEKAKLVTMVGFNFRFEPGLLRVAEILRGGDLGAPLAARSVAGQWLPDWHPASDYRVEYSARRDLGGGVLLDYSHELDMLLWLLGDVTDVSCRVVRTDALEIDTEDLAHLSLAFESGAHAQVQLDYLQRVPRRELEIACEQGTIRWRYDERRLQIHRTGRKVEATELHEDHNETYLSELRHLLECVATRERTSCDLREGMRALALVDAARRAAS